MAQADKYGADDDVDSKLLGNIADHISVNDISTLATKHLGMSSNQFTNCAAGATSALEKIRIVLEKWRDMDTKVSVLCLLQSIMTWQKDGLIDAGVWRTIRKHVEPGVIEAARKDPASSIPQKRQAPATETPCSGGITDEGEIQGLDDKRLHEVSGHVTDKDMLRSLGLELNVDSNYIEQCINNNSSSIQSASYEVLRKFLGAQASRVEAFKTLGKALDKVGLKRTAEEILQYTPE